MRSRRVSIDVPKRYSMSGGRVTCPAIARLLSEKEVFAMRHPMVSAGLAVALVCALAVVGLAERTALKPAYKGNPQDDINVGKEASQEVDKEMQLLRDAQAEAYVNALGKRLAAKAPGEKFPYQFKIVNDKEIN